MISVNCDSGNDDLKSIMAKAGSKVRSTDAKEIPGEPNLVMYLKLAEHLLRKGHFDVDWVALSQKSDKINDFDIPGICLLSNYCLTTRKDIFGKKIYDSFEYIRKL